LQDKLFAISFVEKEGVTLLVDAIEKSTGNNQNYALQAMLSLMQNDVPWNTFGTSLIELVIGAPVLWYSFFCVCAVGQPTRQPQLAHHLPLRHCHPHDHRVVGPGQQGRCQKLWL